jgi:hypothetical protein
MCWEAGTGRASERCWLLGPWDARPQAWLQHALQGRGAEATSDFLLLLLSRQLPPEAFGVVQRLVDALAEAGNLLRCFAAPAQAGLTGPGGALAAAAAAAPREGP